MAMVFYIRKVLQIFCISSLFLMFCVPYSKGTCPPRNLTAARAVRRPCRKTCWLGSGRCTNGKVCKCDHECGYSCINPKNTCGRPPFVVHGQSVHVKRNISGKISPVLRPPYQHDDFVEYKCQPGYDLSQFKPTMCHGRKYWTSGNATCYLVCEPKNFRDIARFNLTCGSSCLADNDCYPDQRCLCDGSCGRSCVNTDIDCGEAPSSSNAAINYTGQGFHRVAHYSCDEGFYLASGSPFRKCTGGGSYDGSLPQCARIECSDPYVAFEATGGEVEKDRLSTYRVGTKVSFHCPSSHRLLGPTSRTCLSDGRWSRLDSVCDLIDTSTRCPHPGVPVNGRIDTNGNFNVGSVVQFQCDPGYLMMGEEKQKCMYFLQWSDGGAPQCIDPDVTSSNFQAVERVRNSLDSLQDYNLEIDDRGGKIASTSLNEKSEIYFFIDISTTESNNCLDQTLDFFRNLLDNMYGDTRVRHNVGVVAYATNAEVVNQIKTHTTGSSKDKVLRQLANVKMDREKMRRRLGNEPNLSNALLSLVELTNVSNFYNVSLEVKRQIYFTTCGASHQEDFNVSVSLFQSNIEKLKDQFNTTLPEVFAVLFCDNCRQPFLNIRHVLLAIATSFEYVIVIKDSKLFQNSLRHDGGIGRKAQIEDAKDVSCGKAGDIKNLKNDVSRVISGRNAKNGSWPWHAVITRNISDLQYLPTSVFGGGSLINHRWILTAAHLFDEFELEDGWHRGLRVVLGAYKLSMTRKQFQADAKMFEPEIVIIHEQFNIKPSEANLQDYDYDVALIKLGREFELPYNTLFHQSERTGWVNYTNLIKPVCLPCMENSCYNRWFLRQENRNSALTGSQTSGYNCANEARVLTADKHSVNAVIGFGSTGSGNFLPTQLQHGRITLKSSDECSSAIPHMHQTDLRTLRYIEANYTYTDRMLCALGDDNGRIVDACQGDSGGALTREIYDVAAKTSCWVQIGIVSWGYGCATRTYSINGTQRNYPGYYTNVFSVMNWIKSHIKPEAACVANRSLVEPGRTCRKSCQTDADCRGKLKRCKCDNVCGMSCFNPNAPCEKLPSIANGVMFGNNSYGETVNYVCNDGFELEGSSVRICRSDKRWNGSQPICKPTGNIPAFTCDPVVVPANGAIGFDTRNGDTYVVNDVVVFQCKNGYRLIGRDYMRCLNEGRWSSAPPTCEALVCNSRDVIVPTNGRIRDAGGSKSGDSYIYNDIVTFECNVGYRLIGSQQIRCLDNGIWNTAAPTCEAFECDPLAVVVPANGIKTVDTRTGKPYVINDIVTFKCNIGYRLIGFDHMRCLDKGKWSAAAPTCDAFECDPVEIVVPVNGRIMTNTSSGQSYVFNNIVTFECNVGYRLLGSHQMRCLDKGRWNVASPTCKAFTCDQRAIVAPANGRMTNDTSSVQYYVFNDIVTFNCNIGYRLIGSDQMRCLDKGKWSTAPPACKAAKPCNRPERLLNISRTEVFTDVGYRPAYGTILTIKCIEWYKMISGSSEWICSDGEWQAQGDSISNIFEDNIPVCRPDCGVKNTAPESILSPHILGGQRAQFGEWPWMAFLDLGGNSLASKKGFCSGSLVEEQYVVTAAHCVESVTRFTIYLGVTDRKNSTNRHVQVFQAVAVYIHENYANSINASLDNNIAVIKLDRPATLGKYDYQNKIKNQDIRPNRSVNFSDLIGLDMTGSLVEQGTVYFGKALKNKVRPICIPRTPREKELPERGARNQAGYKGRGVVIGWGLTELSTSSMHLMMVRVPYVNMTVCQEAYRLESAAHPFFQYTQLTTNMICAGFLTKIKDSCNGDSGGPYMFREPDSKKWYLNGIVSFGTSHETCKKLNILGIYTKVANYIDFLDNFIL